MSVAGKWDVTIQTPLGEQVVHLDFRDEHTGTASYGSESISLGNVTSSGDSASWTVSIVEPMKVTLTCSVTIRGNTMSGTASAGFFGKFGLSGERST